MRSKIIALLVLAATLALVVWQLRWDVSGFQAFALARPLLAGGAYVGFLALTVVALPFSSLPFLPVAARIWGPFTAGCLSILGWWIGCMAAFWVARLGRSVAEKWFSFEAVDRMEKSVPPDVGFFGIVLLRMILPTDVVSFGLGLLKRLKFLPYAVASLIGLIPFAFVWTYAGDALARGKLLGAVTALAVLGVMVLALRWGWERRKR